MCFVSQSLSNILDYITFRLQKDPIYKGTLCGNSDKRRENSVELKEGRGE